MQKARPIIKGPGFLFGSTSNLFGSGSRFIVNDVGAVKQEQSLEFALECPLQSDHWCYHPNRDAPR